MNQQALPLEAEFLPAVRTTQEGEHFMPVVSLQHAQQRYNAIVEFTKTIMRPGVDYGEIPGTNKPTLLKAGAEKLNTFFGLTIEDPVFIDRTEDWTGKDHGGEPFFSYTIMQRVTRNGKLIASQVASINSWEYKYRWRWVKAAELPPGVDKSKLQTKDGSITEFDFAITKAETSGPYGKPAEYWNRFKQAIESGQAVKGTRAARSGKVMDTWTIGEPYYRVPNDRIFDQVNTLIKMCEKRAIVAAVLLATNASEFYTQDIEEMSLVDVHGDAPLPTPRGTNGGASMDDFLGKPKDSTKSEPVGVKHHVGNPKEADPPELMKHGDPPDAAAEQEGVPPPVVNAGRTKKTAVPEGQPANTVGEIGGALSNTFKPPETLATRDGVKPIEDKPAVEQYKQDMKERSDAAMQRDLPTDPVPPTEKQAVEAVDQLAEYKTAIGALTSLDSCHEFRETVIPTVPGDIRMVVNVELLRKELDFETAVLKCRQAILKHPELKPDAERNIARIQEARRKRESQ